MEFKEKQPVRVGIAGLGQLGGRVAGYLADSPKVRLVAAADPRQAARAAFTNKFQGRAYSSVEELSRDPEVEAVFVATPSALHCDHVVALAQQGKHTVLTKPMALTLQECDLMIETAESHGALIIYGMSGMPFQPSLLAMRSIIESGRIGRLRALTHWAFSDWMLRPRYQSELQNDGGLLLNQGPHAIDSIRLLGGGMIRSIRGSTVELPLEDRPCPGYFSAVLEFEDGTPATVTYDGYGYISGWEFTPWANALEGRAALERVYAYRRDLRGGKAHDESDKNKSRLGGDHSGALIPLQPPHNNGDDGGWVPTDDGFIIAHCEYGAVRQSKNGLYIYNDNGLREESFPDSAGTSGEENEIQELLDGLAGRAVFRDGRWGKATLEVVLALRESARLREEVHLRHQVPTPTYGGLSSS